MLKIVKMPNLLYSKEEAHCPLLSFYHWPLFSLFPGESVRSSRGNCRQRQDAAITWQPTLLRARGSLDPREAPSGDCGETRQMPRKPKEIPRRGSFCQDPQYCGIFLQVAVSASVSLPECCLLALLWRNSGLRVAGPTAECVSGLAVMVTMRLWIYFTERA